MARTSWGAMTRPAFAAVGLAGLSMTWARAEDAKKNAPIMTSEIAASRFCHPSLCRETDFLIAFPYFSILYFTIVIVSSSFFS